MTIPPDPPGYADWEAQVPESLKCDPIWRTPAYRLGLMIGDLASEDSDALRHHPRTRAFVDQFVRAAQAISANLTEGYGHLTGRERARYYGYALTSAREARDWYYKARPALGNEVFEERQEVLLRIVRILTAIIPREREARPSPRRRAPSEGTG